MSNYNTKMALEEPPVEDAMRRADLARALASGGFEDVHVVDRETGAKLLTEKRRELVDRLRESEVESVRSLAADLERDVAAVSRDLDLLFEHDVVAFGTDGQRKIPRLKHELVVVEPIA